MGKYEPDDIICLDGGCNNYYCAKQVGITSWMEQKQKKTRLCCKVCELNKTCEKQCNVHKSKCSSMEFFKNVGCFNGEYYRLDGIKSKFYKPSDGTRWWVIYDEKILNTHIKIATDSFYSEEDARNFMKNYSDRERVYLVKGKYIDIKEKQF